ncbi:MAG: transcriptional repressor [Erysipelotrichaceae bacterium]
MRYSSRRDRIYQAIQGLDRHMSAEEVFELVNQEEPKIGLATVYRNLNELAEKNLINKVHDKDQKFFYDGNPTRHYHVYCQQCHTYQDVPVTYMAKLDEEVAKLTGYKVEVHQLVFEGICEKCRTKN